MLIIETNEFTSANDFDTLNIIAYKDITKTQITILVYDLLTTQNNTMSVTPNYSI